MSDLGERGLEALAVRMHADANFETAVGRQARLRLLEAGNHRNAPPGVDRSAVRRLLAIDGEADADPAAVGLAARLPLPNLRQIDVIGSAAQRFGIVAAVEVFSGDVVERHLLRPHEIAPAQFGRLQPDLARDRIEHEFEREADAGARDAAIGQDRAFVGGDRKGAATESRKIIGPGQNARDLRPFEASA